MPDVKVHPVQGTAGEYRAWCRSCGAHLVQTFSRSFADNVATLHTCGPPQHPLVVTDDHQVCDQQQARLVAALEVAADRAYGDCLHTRWPSTVATPPELTPGRAGIQHRTTTPWKDT